VNQSLPRQKSAHLCALEGINRLQINDSRLKVQRAFSYLWVELYLCLYGWVHTPETLPNIFMLIAQMNSNQQVLLLVQVNGQSFS
jgi:hypothetical protein